MTNDYEFVDEIFHYTGQWGQASFCGLKVLTEKLPGGIKTAFILTEMYDENPGVSVTEACCEIATTLLKNHALELEEALFVHQTPDKGSKLEHYKQVFDMLTFQASPPALPSWKRVEKQALIKLLSLP